MARFTVRVVLHDSEGDDYDDLHEYMEQAGFGRTITNVEGVVYKLPPAEYNYTGTITPENVRKKAYQAAKKTNREVSILVTDANSRYWIGLEKA